MLLLLRSLLDGKVIVPPVTPPTSGGATLKPRPSSAPWHWVPFNPVKPRRPKSRRDAELLFLGQ